MAEIFLAERQKIPDHTLTSPHGNRAVSLQERQAEMLRDKIRSLEQRIMEMIRNGSENMVIADRLQHWTRELFLAPSARELPERIVEGLKTQFVVPQAAIRVWDVAPGFEGESFGQGVSGDAKIFASSLTPPYCGVNAGFGPVAWLAHPTDAPSLLLLPLRIPGAQPAFGLVVLASPDSQRFHGSMGTDFLERIAELAGAALSRLR